jgi:Phosphoserine phosphatase
MLIIDAVVVFSFLNPLHGFGESSKKESVLIVYLFIFSRDLISKLHSLGKDVYLVSGGFQSIIRPIADQLSISHDKIFANKFVFDKDGKFIFTYFL